MSKLLHADLSYQVRGVLFDVYNALGPMFREAYYRDAIGISLQEQGVAYELEKGFEIYYQDERIGLYYVDVWIDDGKMLLELKVTPAIEPLHKGQTLSYLKVTDADLALIVNYGASSLEVERLPNFLREKQPEFVWQPHPATADLLYPELVDTIQYACHRVHFLLGTGFLHQIYRRAALIELRRNSLSYEYIKQMPVEYHGHLLGYQPVRLILIEGKVLLATFALRQTESSMLEQLKAHLRRLHVQLGMLANFYGTKLERSIVRV